MPMPTLDTLPKFPLNELQAYEQAKAVLSIVETAPNEFATQWESAVKEYTKKHNLLLGHVEDAVLNNYDPFNMDAMDYTPPTVDSTIDVDFFDFF